MSKVFAIEFTKGDQLSFAEAFRQIPIDARALSYSANFKNKPTCITEMRRERSVRIICNSWKPFIDS